MWRDPIVEEIRRIREEYAAQYHYDIEAICRAAREREKKSDNEIVSSSPRPVPTVLKTDNINE